MRRSEARAGAIDEGDRHVIALAVHQEAELIITRNARTQAKLIDDLLKLDVKVDELAQVNMQLYEMNRLKSDFLANMSQELRTPLNSIIGFSDVLQGIDSLTDKQRRYAENIQEVVQDIQTLVGDVAELSRLLGGRAPVRPGEVVL